MAVYNYLKERRVRKWAGKQKVLVKNAEFCVRAVGGKVQKSNAEVARVAGNGRYGFATRRHDAEERAMTTGRDGQYMKRKKSIARRRKNVSRLATSRQIKIGSKDILQFKEWFWRNATIEGQKIISREKETRKRNRNRKASRGRRKGKS
jgi:hypothetical protein